MMERHVVHAWGFFDEDGKPRTPNGIAVCEGNAYTTRKGVEEGIARHGGSVTDLRTTRTLDGLLVGTEFTTPARNEAHRMWHVIIPASEPWNPAENEELA